jgi:RNA polymerase sigma factor (TIGR02999 family)
MNTPASVTELLHRANVGEPGADAALFERVYGELKAIAAARLASERADHTLQPTALVHEVYLKLDSGEGVTWNDSKHFYRTAARAIRHILVDHARGKKAEKRGGGASKLEFSETQAAFGVVGVDVLELEDAMQKLAQENERLARVVELRFFGGLSVADTARVLEVSDRTVEGDWALARAWLRRELSEETSA